MGIEVCLADIVIVIESVSLVGPIDMIEPATAPGWWEMSTKEARLGMLAYHNEIPLNSEGNGDGYDWALIEIEDEQFKVANEVTISEKGKNILYPQDFVEGALMGHVLAVTGSCNTKGNSLGSPSFIQLSENSRPVEVAVVLLEQSLSKSIIAKCFWCLGQSKTKLRTRNWRLRLLDS